MEGYEDTAGRRFSHTLVDGRSVFYWCDDGELQVPTWGPDDARWITAGVVVTAFGARASVQSSSDDDDWYDWETLLDGGILELEELFDEDDEVDENDDEDDDKEP